MGRYGDVMMDYIAYEYGLNPWHSGPDYTDEEAREFASLLTDNSSDLENNL